MMIKKHLFSVIVLLFILAGSISAQSVLGKWKTVDDNTGKAKSVVKLYLKDGKLYGDIVKLINDDPNYDPLCTECSGDLKNKRILGMTIIKNLQKSGTIWNCDDGIMDPDNGKYYDVKLWREGDKLQVRGYIGPFYRTQTWHYFQDQ